MNIINHFGEFAESYINTKELLIYYGAAEEGRYILNVLKSVDMSPQYFCDKSVDLVGQKIMDIPVISPNEIDSLGVATAHVLVTTTSFHHEGILKVLEKIDTNLIIHLASNIEVGNIEIIADTSSWLRNRKELVERLNFENPIYLMDKEKYIKDVFFPPKTQVVDNKILQMDYTSALVNIVNSKRITKSLLSPCEKKNRIHIFGDSRTLGIGVDDDHTLNTTLENLLSRSELWRHYTVINHSVLGCTLPNMIKILKSESFQNGDIVFFTGGRYDTLLDGNVKLSVQDDAYLFFTFLKEADAYLKTLNVQFIYLYLPRVYDVIEKSEHEEYLSKCYWTPKFLRIEESRHDFERKNHLVKICSQCGIVLIDITENFQRPHNYGEVFLDTTHFSVNGMKLIAECITEYLEFNKKTIHYELSLKYKNLMLDVFNNEIKQIKKQQLLSDSQLMNYVEKLKLISKNKPDQAGIIIVNCNPFTRGHQYLIQESAKKVNHLYVLVLEEDKSYFKFKDRFELVKQGVKAIDNVTVVESGNYIISSFTMPEYFDKDNLQDRKLDAGLDIKIFTTYIAPALKVVKRFVGEEPFCKITAQYNEQMNQILPQYGIQLEIIPRIEADGKAISATNVRNCIKDNDTETLRKLLPDVTLQFLFNHDLISK